MIWRRVALASCLFTFSSASVVAPAERFVPPQTGEICALAMLEAASEVGRRCRPDGAGSRLAELEKAIERLEAHMVARSGATRTQLDAFRAQMSERNRSDAELCQADPLSLYETFASAAPDRLREAVDELIARPGPPEWGSCL